MIELSIVTAKPPLKGPGGVAPGGDPALFAIALADFLKAGGPAPPDPPALPGVVGKRQEVAADGEALPDDEDAAIDPALIWLPVALPPPPIPTAIRLPLAIPFQTSAMTGGPAVVSVASLLEPAMASPTAAAPPPPGEPVAAVADKAAPRPVIDVVAPGHVDGSVRKTLSAAPAQPVPLPAERPVAPTAQPASQVFAAAILAAAGERKSTTGDGPDQASPLTAALTATNEAQRPIVHATADAQRGALDLRQDTGLQGMIDRIEVLRDDANARDTRIRLVPDALGAVDVSVRKSGDTVHVHFTAETAATRTLLADAQPRLAELAEARGVKIGQSSVDSGSGGSARQQSQTLAEPMSPVRATAPDNIDSTTDHRIA